MPVIWKLEDMTRKGELKECDNRTCTSKPQQWGKGGKREVSCSPVMTTSIVNPRHASDRPGKRKGGYMVSSIWMCIYIHRMQIWRTTQSAPGTSQMKARLVRLWCLVWQCFSRSTVVLLRCPFGPILSPSLRVFVFLNATAIEWNLPQ